MKQRDAAQPPWIWLPRKSTLTALINQSGNSFGKTTEKSNVTVWKSAGVNFTQIFRVKPLFQVMKEQLNNEGSVDSSVVRAPDPWPKGHRFESLQELRENFLLQGQLSALTFISVSVPPPHVTAVTHVKDPSHSAQSAGGRLQLNTHAPYVCCFAWSDMVHGCMVYTEHAEMAAISCSSSHVSALHTPLWWIFKNAL